MTVYSVLTEFKFETAEAIAKSEVLQSQLAKVSDAAEQVNASLKSAAWSLLGQVGLYGGISGAIYGAIKAADKYQQSQRSIANIFLSNGMFKGPNAFQQAMVNSAAAMENMKAAAREFSLPSADLVNTAKGLGAVLLNHGLDDSQLHTSTKMARGYLKSAPVLGIDPGLAQSQLINMVLGHASANDTLSQRLMNETAAMRPYGSPQTAAGQHQAGGAMGKFNALRPEVRVKVLTEALMQFGSNASIVTENARSLSAQMQRLSDNVGGMFSILRPIGEAFLEPLKDKMLQLNTWLEGHGEQMSKTFAGIISDMFKDPRGLYEHVQQLRKLKTDTLQAGHLLANFAIMHGLMGILKFVREARRGGAYNFGYEMGRKVKAMGEAVGANGVYQGFSKMTFALSILRFVILDVLAPLVLLTTFLQGISRGAARAQVSGAIWFAEHAAELMELFAKFKNALDKILSPFEFIIEGIAMFTELMLSSTPVYNQLLSWGNQIVFVMSLVGDLFVGLISIVSGIGQVLVDQLIALKNMEWSKLGRGIGASFTDGFALVWDRYHKGPMKEVDNSQNSKANVNIDQINIQNMFKEQMEPDRIAFSLKEQLLKAVSNPVQASGNSMAARASR